MGDLSAHFSRSEFACRCGECGFDTVDAQLLEALEAVRQHFGKPVTINSACRCEAHNARVGGSPNSQHRLGRAADIVVQDVTPESVYYYLHRTYREQFGIGKYPSFVHIDTRKGPARW